MKKSVALKIKNNSRSLNNQIEINKFIFVAIIVLYLSRTNIYSEWYGFGFDYPANTYYGVFTVGIWQACTGASPSGGSAGFSFENPTCGSILHVYNCYNCESAIMECPYVGSFKFICNDIETEPPPLPFWPLGCGLEGNPINPAYGSKLEDYKDISYKNTGYDLEFTRIYNTNLCYWPVSFTAATGNMGTYWRNNYDYTVIKRKERLFYLMGPGFRGWVGGSGGLGSVLYEYFADVIFPDGGRYIFTGANENGPYYYSGRPAWKLENISGGMKLETEDKIYLFNELGTLMAITNKQGNGVFLTYNTGSTEVTDNTGRKLIINKDEAGLISSVDSNISGFIPFVYEHSAYYQYFKLSTVKRNNVIYSRYQYDTYGFNYVFMDRQVDFKKEGIYRDQSYSFTTNDGRIKYSQENATWDSSKKLLKLTYNPDSVTIEDKKGIHTNFYDVYGRIVARIFPDSYESWAYDAGGNVTNHTQRNRTTGQYYYNSNGYLYKLTTTWQDPSGTRSKDEFYDYDSNGNLTSYTDGEGNITTYQYDQEGRITHVVRGGRDVSYSYHATGLVKTIHDGENMSKTYTYDACGNVTLIRNNATGGEETYSYYNSGMDGSVESHTGEDLIEKEYTYDADFPLKIKTITVKEDTAIKDTISYVYTPYGDNSQAGNLESVSDNMGTVEYGYDNAHLLTSVTDRANGGKEYTYNDMWARLTTAEDASGGGKTYYYDNNGNVERVVDGLLQFTRFEYDAAGNRTKVVDRNGKTTNYQYDGLSRLRRVTDANGGITEYDYDMNGNRTLIKDANNNITNYEYDQYDRMVKETFADGSYVSYTYSIGGDLKKREVVKSGSSTKTQNFSYDNGHRLTNDGIYSYSFSCTCGRLGSVSGPEGTISYDYDYKGRIISTTSSGGTVVREYTDRGSTPGETCKVKLDGVELFEVTYDGEGRAENVVEKVAGASNTFGFTRDNMGRVIEIDYPNLDSSTTEYDLEGRIKKHRNYYKNKLINKFEETLDAEGNKLKEKTNVGTRNYGYDSIYQLTSATYERNQAYNWQYDNAGNRLVETQLAVSRSYAPNWLNQYTSVNSVNYGYDSDGNLLSDGTRSFGWDVKNHLTTAVNGSTTVTYKYDHNDLRVEKTVGGVTTKYFYDGSHLLAEKVGSQITKIYINDGEGIIGMVRPIYDGSNNLTHYQRLYYLYDTLGSVSTVTGENGLPLQNYTYSPFGACLNVTGDPINNLQFVGRYGGYKDSDTDLTYFWHRWYDSRDGRWISRDPSEMGGGVVGDRFFGLRTCNSPFMISYYDDSNSMTEGYKYSYNNPVKFVDIDGNKGIVIPKVLPPMDPTNVKTFGWQATCKSLKAQENFLKQQVKNSCGVPDTTKMYGEQLRDFYSRNSWWISFCNMMNYW